MARRRSVSVALVMASTAFRRSSSWRRCTCLGMAIAKARLQPTQVDAGLRLTHTRNVQAAGRAKPCSQRRLGPGCSMRTVSGCVAPPGSFLRRSRVSSLSNSGGTWRARWVPKGVMLHLAAVLACACVSAQGKTEPALCRLKQAAGVGGGWRAHLRQQVFADVVHHLFPAQAAAAAGALGHRVQDRRHALAHLPVRGTCLSMHTARPRTTRPFRSINGTRQPQRRLHLLRRSRRAQGAEPPRPQTARRAPSRPRPPAAS